MEIYFKRFDRTIPSPMYKTAGSAGMDLSSRIDVVIKPKEIMKVPLNVAVKIPKGYVGLQIARSSLHKMGLMLINAVGVIDSDYCGDDDEWLALLYNFTDKDVSIEKGMRLVQMLIVEALQITLKESPALTEKNRGGIGTTGFI